MFAMFVLTCLIGLLAVAVRINSVRNGSVRPRFYQLMQGQDVPELVTKTTRCINNMFEVPTLFYAVSVLYIAVGVNSDVAVGLAWCFVALRLLQAVIHLSYNHVLHRMVSFFLGLACLAGLWGILLGSL
tara:strand:+ start:1103 stop:1489 length:387 start_codon:yes stop_codon:yes gene_type:complete